MYASLVIAALSGSLIAPSARESLTWQSDYGAARKIGQTEKKPLAVFIGKGARGYEKVCKDGKLSAEMEKLLGENYVCVYVDTATPEGQKLASAFNNTQSTGLILSDRAGDNQAFAHNGDLSAADMNKWLQRFMDPNVVVRTTMNNTSTQVSSYPSMNSAGSYPGNVIYGSQGYMYGNMGSSGYMYGGNVMFGGGCPGGNCGGSIRRY